MKKVGFTLIEMAIVLIIIGIIAGLLMPAIFKGIERDKVSTGKLALDDFKEEIIGYAVDEHLLPSNTTQVVQQRDVWGTLYKYVHQTAPDITNLDICTQSGANMLLTPRSGGAVSEVAFAVISAGQDRAFDGSYTYGPPPSVDLSNANDDLVEYVTFFELYRKVCTTGQTTDSTPENPPEGQILFDDGMTGFTNPVGYTTSSSASATIVVDKTTRSTSMGQNIRDGAGCLWFQGNASLLCSSGNCTFGTGLRAYFEFDFTGTADGFTFAVINAESNNASSCGGQGVGDDSQGENLGYAGDGEDNRGINSPKMALEFDIYHNGCGDVCSSGSRCDASAGASTGPNHLAFIYWGTNALDCSASSKYDDNRHGAGSGYIDGDQPTNSHNETQPGGSDGYYIGTGGTEWLENGNLWSVRMEIVRNQTVNDSGNYGYELQAWLQSGAGSGNFIDMSKDYTDSSADVWDGIHLSPTLHNNMNMVLFGWTEGTGAETQSVTISNFKMSFRQ